MSEIRRDPAFSGAGERSEQIQGHPARDGAQIEQLQDQLADLLYPPDGGEIDVEALDALLEQMEAVSPLPASLSTDPEEGLERFRRRYASVIEAESAGAETETGTGTEVPAAPEKRHSKKPFAKALPLVAVLILLLGAMTVQVSGTNVFGAIAYWTSEILRLGGLAPYAMVTVQPLEEGETAIYESLEEAVAAFGIEAPLVPKEIPEGFELSEVTATNRDLGLLIIANYENGDRHFQVRYREVDIQDFNTLEKENTKVNSYFKGGIKHKLTSDLGRQKAMWQNGDFECQLFGDVSEQEMKATIKSIYQGVS